MTRALVARPLVAGSFVLVAVLLAAGCGGGDGSKSNSGSGPSVTPPSGHAIAFDFGFKPQDVTIKAGESITWKNTGKQIHTVKQLPGAPAKFFSKAIDVGQSYSRRFSKPGRYPYFCTLHPTLMKGVVVVK